MVAAPVSHSSDASGGPEASATRLAAAEMARRDRLAQTCDPRWHIPLLGWRSWDRL